MNEKVKKFLDDVRELSEKYGLNYFIVSDGASSINNNGNEAITYIHNCFKEWEKQQGII